MLRGRIGGDGNGDCTVLLGICECEVGRIRIIENGELLRRATSFEVFVTADRGIEHQQNLDESAVGIVVLVAKSNRLESYVPLAGALAEAVRSVGPSKLVKITA